MGHAPKNSMMGIYAFTAANCMMSHLQSGSGSA